MRPFCAFLAKTWKTVQNTFLEVKSDSLGGGSLLAILNQAIIFQ
jgi:hypothetical protein